MTYVLYCATAGDITKVGISSNVHRRLSGLKGRSAGIAVALDCADAPVELAATWPLVGRTRSEALAVESACHAAIKDLGCDFWGEWVRCHVDRVRLRVDETLNSMGVL